MNIQLPNSIDLTAILGEYFVHTLIDKSFLSLKSLFHSSNVTTNLTKADFEDNFRYELTKTVNWAHEVSLKEFNYSQNIKSIYVELDLYFSLRRSYQNADELKKHKFSELLNEYSEHLIILGQPGAGKTTSLKHLCYSLLFEEKNDYNNFKVPLVIRLRDLNSDLVGIDEKYGLCIFRYIFTKLGINIDYHSTFEQDQKRNLIIKSVVTVLEELNILLVLDGLDEVTDFKKKDTILKEFNELALGLTNSRVILTSRLGEFHARFDNSLVFEICSLSKEQINEFAIKRFNDELKAKLFLEQLLSSTYYDTALRPLTLAYLTLIYERYGRIHDKPKEIYKRILRLLIEEWNVQNSVHRESKYSNFDSDRKLEFLAALSYTLTVTHRTTSFTDKMLVDAYSSICSDFSLPQSQVKKVLSENENHNGLFLQTFYNTFEFSHKSLQEYLTADYLSRQPIIDDYHSLIRIPNELAISVALSAAPTKYLNYIVFKIIRDSNEAPNFYKTFCTRLFIEKPDFNETPELICCFLFMYKVMKRITDKNIKEPFSEDSYQTDGKIGGLITLFEDFFGSETCINSFKMFKNYYQLIAEPKRIDYNKKTGDGYETVTINFFKRSKSIPQLDKLNSPTYLPISDHLLRKVE